MKGSCAVIGKGMKTTANDSREEDGMSEITILIAALAFGLLAYVRIALLAVLGYVAGAVEKT